MKSIGFTHVFRKNYVTEFLLRQLDLAPGSPRLGMIARRQRERKAETQAVIMEFDACQHLERHSHLFALAQVPECQIDHAITIRTR